jgi:protein tyrosine phosphatase
VFKKQVKLIIMLCNLFEDTRTKCDQYWPIDTLNPIEVNKLKIKLISESYMIDNQVLERKILVSSDEGEFICSHIHVMCWPDHATPEAEITYNLFDSLIKKIHSSLNEPKNNSPVIIHCSAGVGRTGTMMALYNIFDILDRQLKLIKSQQKNTSNRIYFSVFTQVRKLREQRFLSVTDLCQYKLIYQYAYEWIQKNCLNRNDE